MPLPPKTPGLLNARSSEESQPDSFLSFNRHTSPPTLLSTPDREQAAGRGSGGMLSGAFKEPRALSAGTTAWLAKSRPLSDIQEITEASLIDAAFKQSQVEHAAPKSVPISRRPSVASRPRHSTESSVGRDKEHDGPKSPNRNENGIPSGASARPCRTPSPRHSGDNSYCNIYSIPRNSIPARRSSQIRTTSAQRPRPSPSAIPPLPLPQRPPVTPHSNNGPSIPPPPPSGNEKTIPSHGQSRSPVRQVAARLDPVSCDTNRPIPSRTFIREPLSGELLDFPTHRHPRIHVGLDLAAGIFVGGGTIEGTVQLRIHDSDRVRYRKTLDIARISVDLLGLEEMVGHKRSLFLNLATELIDNDNPPPRNMVVSQQQIGSNDPFWHLAPSSTKLPFVMSLPLNVGPPPFHSRNARIRYVLCVSLLVRDRGKQYIVRTSEDVSVLSVYDPEKALMSLPSPLTASDELIKLRDSSLEIVRLTAGLHRQVWVSGTIIYVDVHIANNTHKAVKKIELQLERDLLCYKHAAAATMEKSASQARIFDSNERTILSKSVIKAGSAGWHGVPAHTTQVRTCDLEVPRGHATVKCGKYFEVRFFLNVIASVSFSKTISVQLPIVLIHMNSLDIVPNSVAQVAAAIEEKRTAQTYTRGHSPPRRHGSVQGRAFAAPRLQSLEHMRAEAEDLHQLGQMLERTPRKYSTQSRLSPPFAYRTPPSNRKGRLLGPDDVATVQRHLRHVRSSETLGGAESASSAPAVGRGSQNHRIGAGSALGFRDAEVREDIELGGLGINNAPTFKQQLEQLRRRGTFGKKRSAERWRELKDVGALGVGWLKGTGSMPKGEGEGLGIGLGSWV